MQFALTADGFKVHCAPRVIARALHPAYSDAQVERIAPFVKRAAKSLTTSTLRLRGLEIVAMDHGWTFFRTDDVAGDARRVLDAWLGSAPRPG